LNSAEFMRSKTPRRHAQQSLEDRWKPVQRGGKREGAGRKKQVGSVSHDARPQFPARYPQHVTLRLCDGVGSLARDWLMKIIRKAIRAAHKLAFRIVEFNVLGNHIHLVTEAGNAVALAAGMQGTEVRLARRLNAALRRCGKLFAHRYHSRYLKTPREVRNVLRYVLLNRKHHDAEKKFSKSWIDPYSSAAWFRGWAAPIRVDTDWKRELVEMEPPTAPATVWLLTTGWIQRYGPIAFDDRPA